ncbi:uncharacterized protein LOC116338511 [Contarinia nasturtii]|uniref:uncharacterized protein LOC116338511 n=1 Tax=Contarinia nasturtii TaxID=265458 RepID=UPI0012D483ED|nr:uncharacterized protein LOC116338511 [Contarinia nasturtii]
MKKVAALVILLAGMLACKAHDTNSPAGIEGWSNAQSKTPASRSQNPSNQSETAQHSVVVNWLLVCEDLCGAGYGGPTCGKLCNAENGNQTQEKKYKSANLCSVLCDFGLGGKNCNCGKNQLKPPKNTKDICNAICRELNLSVDGCSKCISLPHSYHKKPSSAVFNFNDINESATDESVTTTEDSASITTIDTTPDTPDWNVVCIELCKKGEGGALCNCDLPPLSMKCN